MEDKRSASHVVDGLIAAEGHSSQNMEGLEQTDPY